MAFKETYKLNDVPKGTMKHVEIENHEILIANIEGKIYAIDDRCGHMSTPLSMGTLKGNIVECALHHAQFDVTTGQKVREPQMGGLSGRVISVSPMGKLMAMVKTYDRKSYTVRVEDGVIQIDIQPKGGK